MSVLGWGTWSIFLIINNVGIGELNLTKLSPKCLSWTFSFCSFSISSFSCLFRLAISSFFFLPTSSKLNCIVSSGLHSQISNSQDVCLCFCSPFLIPLVLNRQYPLHNDSFLPTLPLVHSFFYPLE